MSATSTPNDLGRLTHSYKLVEGTVSVDRKDVPAFAAAGIDLKALAGKRLRVRGFLGWRNGPMIEASHPEQIELLPEAPKQDMPPPRPTAPAIAL